MNEGIRGEGAGMVYSRLFNNVNFYRALGLKKFMINFAVLFKDEEFQKAFASLV